MKKQSEAYLEDLERYEKFIATTRYEEVRDYLLRVVSGLPSYTPAMGAQNAYLLRAALAVEAGDLDAALSAAERDLAFQRLFLANTNLDRTHGGVRGLRARLGFYRGDAERTQDCANAACAAIALHAQR